jgi:hypothetical protein
MPKRKRRVVRASAMHGLVVVVIAAGAHAVHPAPAPPSGLPRNACGDAVSNVGDAFGSPESIRRRQLHNRLDRAVADYRFHRREQALARLDALRTTADRWLPANERQAARSAIGALSKCFASTPPPERATLIVKTFTLNPDAPDMRGPTAGAGVYVQVEGVDVGRTGADGTLSLQVPSGAVLVEAMRPPNEAGQVALRLPAGGTGVASIVLDDGKEPGFEVDVDVAEAVNDVVSPTAKSFTLTVTRDGAVVPITEIYDIDVLDRNLNIDLYLRNMFWLESNTITAKNASELLALLRSRGEIVMKVDVYDSKSRLAYAGTATFRVGSK